MKILKRLFLALCLLCLVDAPVVAFTPAVRGMVGAGGATVAPAGECTSTLICQNAEGTGYDNSETWAETGTVNEDCESGSCPLRGLQSISVNAGAYTQIPFASSGTVSAHFIFRTSSVTLGDHDYLFRLIDSGGTPRAQAVIRSTGQWAVNCGGGSTLGADSPSANTTYHIWLDYTRGAGTGSCVLYIGTDTNKPVTAEASRTSQTTDYAVERVMLYTLSVASRVSYFDQIIIKTSAFASVSP